MRWPRRCGFCGDDAPYGSVRGWSKWVHGNRRITACPACWARNQEQLAEIAELSRF